jgi:hypothetical protein
MNALPLQFLMLIFAGWISRHQQDVIDYLEEENRALRERMGGKRLRFIDQQRRRLAAKAKMVGRKGLSQIETSYCAKTLPSRFKCDSRGLRSRAVSSDQPIFARSDRASVAT